MLKGHVDNITRNRVIGWAADFESTNRPVSVTVVVNGQALPPVFAEQRREDVERAFGKNGNF